VEYDRRLETLRRSRDDLASAAAAAAAASARRAAEKRAAEVESQRQRQQQQVTTDRGGDGGAQDVGNPGGVGSKPRRGRHHNVDSGGGGGGVFGGRHAEGGGGDQAADEAEAEQVAQEISSMAGRLKDSSMAINQTLRTQTQVRSAGEGAGTHRLSNGRKFGLALGIVLSPPWQSTPTGAPHHRTEVPRSQQ